MPSLFSRLRARIAAPAIAKSSQLFGSFIRGEDMDEPALARGLPRPYARSPWVGQAIQKIAMPCSAVALEFYDVATEEETQITDPAFAAFWRKPALDAAGQRLPRADVVNALVSWWKLSGEFFLLLDSTWSTRGLPLAARSPFIIARPDRMRQLVRNGELLGWMFTDAAGRQIPFLPEEVIHRKRFNPYDDFRGLSEFEAAQLTAESDYMAAQFGKNLNAANGDQGVYVVAKQGITDDKQREQIEAALMEKQRRQKSGQPTITFVNGDVAVQDPQIRGFDANTLTSRLQNRQEVAVAFGLPASCFEVKAAYSIGSASDEYQIIANVSQPTAAVIAGAFSVLGSRLLHREVEACFDWDDHPTMQAVRRERIDTGLKLWGTGMPMDEVSDYLDLGLPSYPGSAIGYLPFSVAPVDAAPVAGSDLPAPGADMPAPSAAPIPADPGIEQLRLVLLARQRAAAPVCQAVPAARAADPLALFCCALHGAPGELGPGKARDSGRIAIWRALMADRRKTVKAYKSRLGSELMKARAETLAKIDAADFSSVKARFIQAPPPIAAKALAADFLFDLSKWAEGVQVALRGVARDALDTAGAQIFSEVGRADPFKFPPEAVLEHVQQRRNYISNATDGIFEEIKGEIEAGLVAGDTQAQLSARVKAAFNGIDSTRAQRIALTETSAAYGAGRAEGMKQAGVEWKQWLTSGNANVRPFHLEADGQTVPLDEPFVVEGEQLMHPGDSAGGSPGNVINCHCVSIAVEGPSS